MAVKITIHEKCPKCGARNAKIIGEMIRSGHYCSDTPPGPPTSPWREHRLTDVVFVPGDFDATFLTQELREAWKTIEDFGQKRWLAERAAVEAVVQAMRTVYEGRLVPPPSKADRP